MYVYKHIYKYIYIYIYTLIGFAWQYIASTVLVCVFLSDIVLILQTATIFLYMFSHICYLRLFISLRKFACDLTRKQRLIREPFAKIICVNEFEQIFPLC